MPRCLGYCLLLTVGFYKVYHVELQSPLMTLRFVFYRNTCILILQSTDLDRELEAERSYPILVYVEFLTQPSPLMPPPII